MQSPGANHEDVYGIFKHIEKRDGQKAVFDATKISSAIYKASVATAGEDIPDEEIARITREVVLSLPRGATPNVEQIQDIVERKLIQSNFAKTAKAYILYRAEHARLRDNADHLMRTYNELTFSYSKDADIKRENANIDADSAMGTMLKYGSEGSKYYIDNYILPQPIAKAHIHGDIHIHDKDFYMLTETCCQIDLLSLFKDGFSTGHGYLREPNSITSYSALGCIAIQANQNEMHGGQSVPNFDYAMAPGVDKTFNKEYRRALLQYAAVFSNKRYGECKSIIDACDFTPKLDDIDEIEPTVCSLLENEFGISQDKHAHILSLSYDTAYAQTDRMTYQAMEALVHNLNTMNSRAGAQVPFSSINYGTDTSAAGRMVMRNLLNATDAGLGNGETPIFPVQIFKVKEGINYNAEDKNFDLFQLAIKTSAKRLFPNFSFLDAPFNLHYYKEGDYNSEVAYMGCRTRVMGNVFDPTREVTCGRGNLSFTSINLPRLGIRANKSVSTFFALLEEKIDLCIEQLLHRLKIQSHKRGRNYPFLMGQGIWIDADSIGPDDTIQDVLKHGTLSIGFIGLAETLKALTGFHHGENEASQQLGLRIVSYMRERLDAVAQEKKLNFTLLATPAEGLSGRFVAIDREKYGEIEGVTDREYYTNSFHVPVYYPIRAFEKISIEAPYHALTNAGHISYVELDGDTTQNVKAFEKMIRHMKESGIGYGSVNHPVDRDPVCSYSGIIGDVCPRCGRTEDDGVRFERIRRITGYLVGTTERFNNAKQKEEQDRLKHGV
ncbi:MAG: anaerobic ribonucleoside triphosphate reductase [Christensenellales bacterium]|jgi:anaerobic ribonucleoside-triphosphate reductase